MPETHDFFAGMLSLTQVTQFFLFKSQAGLSSLAPLFTIALLPNKKHCCGPIAHFIDIVPWTSSGRPIQGVGTHYGPMLSWLQTTVQLSLPILHTDPSTYFDLTFSGGHWRWHVAD